MKTLTLRPKPVRMIQKAMPPVPADPVKIALAQRLGLRFVCQQGRYILQSKLPLMVTYEPPAVLSDGTVVSGHAVTRAELTWIDIPLVPEVYG